MKRFRLFIRKPVPFEYEGLPLIPLEFVYVSMVLLSANASLEVCVGGLDSWDPPINR